MRGISSMRRQIVRKKKNGGWPCKGMDGAGGMMLGVILCSESQNGGSLILADGIAMDQIYYPGCRT
jgi:hypothetical protein